MKDIKTIIEGIVSQGKFVGSRGHAFRASSSSGSSGGKHDHGIDIGARRNFAHQMATKKRVDQSAKQRQQEVDRRNKEAEQRRKETASMAKEDIDEARKPGDLMGRKGVQDFLRTRDILSGKKPLETKPSEPEKKSAPAVAKEETIEEGMYAKHETDHLKQMHARDVGAISRYKGKMGAGIDDVIDREHAIRKELKKRGHSVEKPKHKLVIEAEVSKGTEARVKIKNVARMDDPAPTSEKSVLGKQGEIKTKIIDEEKPTMSMPNFGLPASLIAAARQIVEKKQDDGDDPKKMTGGKTQVEINPETDDKIDESGTKKHTVPKTPKDKKLAALAHPKDKITHKDVLVGRGVVKEEEVELSAEEQARIAEIAKSFPAEIDEAVKKSKNVPSATTATSAPIRGANQDQSGVGTKSSTADYTISDDAKFSNMHGNLTTKKVKPKMAKEEVEIDEAKLPSMTIQVTKPSFGKQKIHNLAHDVEAKHPDTGHDLSPGDNVTPEHLKKLKSQGHSIEVVDEQVNIEEGRGRPRKNPLPPGQEAEGDDTHKHPMQQLEKISHAFEGKEPHFEHKDGSKSKISRHLARHIVAIHNSMKTTQEKDNFAQKVHANRDSMKSEVGKHL